MSCGVWKSCLTVYPAGLQIQIEVATCWQVSCKPLFTCQTWLDKVQDYTVHICLTSHNWMYGLWITLPAVQETLKNLSTGLSFFQFWTSQLFSPFYASNLHACTHTHTHTHTHTRLKQELWCYETQNCLWISAPCLKSAISIAVSDCEGLLSLEQASFCHNHVWLGPRNFYANTVASHLCRNGVCTTTGDCTLETFTNVQCVARAIPAFLT